MSTLIVRVEGRVQGVCFRHYTREKAVELRLGGWVRNCPDGAVETLIHGPDEAVEQMLAWLKHGPSAAVVSRIQATPADAEVPPSGFKIMY
ncbi:MAG: acylphosphatase [Mariprofundaceae bacterium]|nr:acylphosphatase [Mariprofundaceae bacterium]